MIRKRHSTAKRMATALALALAAAIVFAILAPVIAVPLAVMIESTAADPEAARAKAGWTFFFGFFWMGVWMAMALVPGAGFALLGWMPFWFAGAKRMDLRKWWIAMIWGGLAGLIAVLVFLFVEGFASLPGGGGKWRAATVIGGAVGGSMAGALLFLLSVRLMPRVRVEQLIPKMVPVIPEAPSPPMGVEKVEKIPAPTPEVRKKGKKKEDLKWTDWGKVWKPPGEE